MVMINQMFLIQFVKVLLFIEYFTTSPVKAESTTIEAKTSTSTLEATLPVEGRPTETEAMAGTSQTMGVVFSIL